MKSEIEKIAEQPKIPTSDGKKIIYVAGKYRGKTDHEQTENIMHAQRVSLRLWELGYVVFTPHLNTAHFNWYSSLPDEVWLKGGLEILSRCDAIFMLSNWKESRGAMVEFELAKKLGLEIYYE